MFNYGKESAHIEGHFTIETALNVSWPTDILNSEVTPIKEPFQTQQRFQGKTYELGYEHCVSIVEKWFWKSDEILKSVAELNGNFLLNVPPDNTGRIPDATVTRLQELRIALDEIKDK